MTRQQQILNIKDELNDIVFSKDEHKAEVLIIEAMQILKFAVRELDEADLKRELRREGVR